MKRYTRGEVARTIDHSLLQPAMTDAELAEGCRAAAGWGVASVCVKPYFTAEARRLLEGSGVNAGTTIGFPHGGHATSVKVAEARTALSDGAQELDMVINIGKAKSGDWKRGVDGTEAPADHRRHTATPPAHNNRASRRLHRNPVFL